MSRRFRVSGKIPSKCAKIEATRRTRRASELQSPKLNKNKQTNGVRNPLGFQLSNFLSRISAGNDSRARGRGEMAARCFYFDRRLVERRAIALELSTTVRAITLVPPFVPLPLLLLEPRYTHKAHG